MLALGSVFVALNLITAAVTCGMEDWGYMMIPAWDGISCNPIRQQPNTYPNRRLWEGLQCKPSYNTLWWFLQPFQFQVGTFLQSY